MMNYTLTVKNNSIVYIKSEDILITDAQSALDLMMTVKYDTGCSRLVLDKGAISEDFQTQQRYGRRGSSEIYKLSYEAGCIGRLFQVHKQTPTGFHI